MKSIKGKKERPPGWLRKFFKKFALENEIPHQVLGNGKIVYSVRSRFQKLNIVFEIREDNNGYEHFTPVLVVPKSKRQVVAETAISEAYREISPVLPYDDDRLFLYGSVSDLGDANEVKIREGILDVIGRVVGYDNEKYPEFKRIVV